MTDPSSLFEDQKDGTASKRQVWGSVFVSSDRTPACRQAGREWRNLYKDLQDPSTRYTHSLGMTFFRLLTLNRLLLTVYGSPVTE